MINGLRGLVAEFGVYVPRGLARVIGFAEGITLGEVLDLPDIANEVIRDLSEQLTVLHGRVRWYEERLKQVAKQDARVRLLRTIPGVGTAICGLAWTCSQTAIQWRKVPPVWD